MNFIIWDEPAERREPVDSNGKEISAKQSEVALALVTGDGETHEILDEYGVSEDEFTSWIRDAGFRDHIDSLARDFAEAGVYEIWKSLMKHAKEGSVPAIKLYFEMKNKRVTESRSGISPDINDLRRDIFGDD